MNALDIAIAALLLAFAALGAWRGFVRELVSLVTWVAACLGAWAFADSLASVFDGITQEPALRQVIAFVVIFIGVFAVGLATGLLLHRFVNRNAGLRLPNRFLGGVVGLTRGAVLVVALFLLAGLTSFPQRDWWREAALSPVFQRAALAAAHYIPRDVARHIRYG
jgi:membrane protein required for colicin V production